MELNSIKPASGAKHAKRRVGRGIGSGLGKTAGRGHKGQKSRTGVRINGFEGGQMPMHRRLPKKGFNNALFQDAIEVVNVGDLNEAFQDGATVNEAALREVGLVSRTCDVIKILGTGELARKLTIQGAKVSASAREKIEKAGGSIAA